MSTTIGVSELVGIAQSGGSLKTETFRHSVIGAVGMASASGKASHALGCELHRLRCAGQAGRWDTAAVMLQKQIAGLARKRRWRQSKHLAAQISRMSHLGLQDWLFDLCVPCLGRGEIAIELYNPDGTRKAVVCDACGGSRRPKQEGRNMQERMSALGVPENEYIKVWDERFAEVIALCDKAYGVAQRAVARRLGRRIEDA